MADYYHTRYQSYYDRTADIDPSGFLSAFVRYLTPGARVLDVGCGSGRDLLWLKNKGFSPIGFERSSGLAELAEKHSGCPVVRGDFKSHDFSSFEVDALVCSGAFVHVEQKDLAGVLKNVLRALVPGGYLFFSLKQGQGTRSSEDGRQFTLWQHTDLAAVFETRGLEIKDFQNTLSAMETGEPWLGYVLEYGPSA